MKQTTCHACGAELAEPEGETTPPCGKCGADPAAPKTRKKKWKLSSAEDFDPMDVLNAPVEEPASPSPVRITENSADTTTPVKGSTSPTPDQSPGTTPDTATTGAAAQSAMAAMNRPAVPQPRSATQPAVSPAPQPSRSVRELISSPGDVVTLLRERPIYAVLLGSGILWLVVFGSRGCNDNRVPTYPVHGRVVFADGSVVRTGKIEFESDEYGTTSTGKINEDGSFVLGTYESEDGAPAGGHRVIVMQLVIQDPTIKHSKDHGAPVDPRFARYDTSGLSATVTANDSNHVTIQVEPQQRYDQQHHHE